jgi:AN1-like Zinc finger
MSKYIESEEDEISGLIGRCKRKAETVDESVPSYKRVDLKRRGSLLPEKREVVEEKPGGYYCARCSKKLRMTTVFECSCGSWYCGRHRYSDEHACTYDHRAKHMRKIERENPRIVPAKIQNF